MAYKMIGGSPVITVGDLIKGLQEFSPETPVIYSHDDEGNEFQTIFSLPREEKIKEFTQGGRFLDLCEHESECSCIKVVCVN